MQQTIDWILGSVDALGDELFQTFVARRQFLDQLFTVGRSEALQHVRGHFWRVPHPTSVLLVRSAGHQIFGRVHVQRQTSLGAEPRNRRAQEHAFPASHRSFEHDVERLSWMNVEQQIFGDFAIQHGIFLRHFVVVLDALGHAVLQPFRRTQAEEGSHSTFVHAQLQLVRHLSSGIASIRKASHQQPSQRCDVRGASHRRRSARLVPTRKGS
mmetsp:Transcript_4373/g.27850  ORF Transcript_4373/g.27850 Transcript_4373/m.27850 type:complete len:212 (-) Transcript_4373:2176-2811(-)